MNIASVACLSGKLTGVSCLHDRICVSIYNPIFIKHHSTLKVGLITLFSQRTIAEAKCIMVELHSAVHAWQCANEPLITTTLIGSLSSAGYFALLLCHS